MCIRRCCHEWWIVSCNFVNFWKKKQKKNSLDASFFGTIARNETSYEVFSHTKCSGEIAKMQVGTFYFFPYINFMWIFRAIARKQREQGERSRENQSDAFRISFSLDVKNAFKNENAYICVCISWICNRREGGLEFPASPVGVSFAPFRATTIAWRRSFCSKTYELKNASKMEIK